MLHKVYTWCVCNYSLNPHNNMVYVYYSLFHSSIFVMFGFTTQKGDISRGSGKRASPSSYMMLIIGVFLGPLLHSVSY